MRSNSQQTLDKQRQSNYNIWLLLGSLFGNAEQLLFCFVVVYPPIAMRVVDGILERSECGLAREDGSASEH